MMNIYETIRRNHELWKVFTSEIEYSSNHKDKHNRYVESPSFLYDTPIISDYLIKQGAYFHYPDKKKFAVCLTHDIDNIHYKTSNFISYLYNNGFNKHFFSNIKYVLQSNNVFKNFDIITDLEKEYGAKSTFFILMDEFDFKKRYLIDDIKFDLLKLMDDGYEIGLHGGYYSYDDENLLAKEKLKLERFIGKKVIGIRNHYLRFETPKTWVIQKKCDFKYDTTYGYSKSIGFRNGLCHPFKPFDNETNDFIDILEIPLNIMDINLKSNNLNTLWIKCKKTIDLVKRNSGVLTILWHNESLLPEYRPILYLLYQKILDYCKRNEAWMTSCSSLYEWWKNEY